MRHADTGYLVDEGSYHACATFRRGLNRLFQDNKYETLSEAIREIDCYRTEDLFDDQGVPLTAEALQIGLSETGCKGEFETADLQPIPDEKLVAELAELSLELKQDEQDALGEELEAEARREEHARKAFVAGCCGPFDPAECDEYDERH